MTFFRRFSQAAAFLALLTGAALAAWGISEALPYLDPAPHQVSDYAMRAQDGMAMIMAGVPLLILGALVMLIEAWRRKHGEGIRK